MNIDWIMLKPFLDAAAGATLPLLAFCYFRLDSKIEKTDSKIENSKKEIKEEIIRLEQKTEQRFERLETKLDRLVDIILMQKQNYRPHKHRPKPNKDVG